MKNKKIIIELLLSLLIGGFTYYVLDSLIFAIINAAVTFTLLMFALKELDKTKEKMDNINNAYNFINLLNVQMLGTKNVYQAYKSIESYSYVDFTNIDNETFHEQLEEIAERYDINSFKMYIKSLIIYDNEGGDFTHIEEIPSALILKNKIYYERLKSEKTLRFVDISTMYLLSLLIIIFLKSSLDSYYRLMIDNNLFAILLEIIILGALVSYFLAFIIYSKNKIKGL